MKTIFHLNLGNVITQISSVSFKCVTAIGERLMLPDSKQVYKVYDKVLDVIDDAHQEMHVYLKKDEPVPDIKKADGGRVVHRYTVEELCNEYKKIIIRSQDGIEIGIEPTPNGTLLNFYLGNELIKFDDFNNWLIKNK